MPSRVRQISEVFVFQLALALAFQTYLTVSIKASPMVSIFII